MIQVYLSNLHCLEENDSSASDEPYVLVTAVDLASTMTIENASVPVPAFDVVRYGPFEGVDAGGTYSAPGSAQSFWGITGRSAALDNPDQAIFVAAVMEHDAGRPGTLQGIVKGVVGGSVLGSLSLDRGSKVAALIRDVSSALGTPSGPSLDQDDRIGEPQELRFSREELIRAESGQTVSKTLAFEGDGGQYTLTFEARSLRVAANPQDKWVLTMGNRVLVITQDGSVFAHDITGNTVGVPFRLSGVSVAANPQDKWVLTMGNRVLVITQDGRVYAHDITGNTVGIPYQLS